MSKPESLRVLVAKSDRLLADFLCDFIKTKKLNLVGQVCNRPDAMKLLIEQSPDILIVGADLGGVNGLDLVGYILEKKLHTKSIVFSRDKSPALLTKARQLRVAGLLFADDGRPELSRCLEMVMAGNSYVSPGVEKRLLEGAGRVLSGWGLTAAELKILWLVSQHLSVKEIAEKLFISQNTVSNHQTNIRKKLGLKGRNCLLKYVLDARVRFVEVNGQVWLKPGRNSGYPLQK